MTISFTSQAMQVEMGNSESTFMPCLNNNENQHHVRSNRQNAILITDQSGNATHPSQEYNNDDKVTTITVTSSGVDSQSVELNSTNSSIHRKINTILQQLLRRVEDFLFPKSLLISNSHIYNDNHVRPKPQVSRNISGRSGGGNGILLRHCETLEQQNAYIRTMIQTCQHLHGNEGLKVLGLEYRMIQCDEHKENKPAIQHDDDIDECVLSSDEGTQLNGSTTGQHDMGPFEMDIDEAIDEINKEGEVTYVELAKIKSEKYVSKTSFRSDSIISDDGSCSSAKNAMASRNAEICTTPSLGTNTAIGYDIEDELFDIHGRTKAVPNGVVYKNAAKRIEHRFCNLCVRRLYDVKSNTPIDDTNRKEFIADGDMYELVSRLVQEYAHDIMIQVGHMEWVTIEDSDPASTSNAVHQTVPIRMLISSNHPCLCADKDRNSVVHRPTVVICTGRGKVRGGIFSRHHLICTGLEQATAIPYIYEALHRNLHVVIIDPNIRGESNGFITFSQTMDYLGSYFGQEHKMSPQLDNTLPSQNACCRDLFVLSHSASGGHFTRYFLDKCDTPYIRNIRAIAFTDSTHSIQWAKGSDQTFLYELLQSAQCIYFRCSSSTRDTIAGDGNTKWYLHPAGETVHTDSFWRHRFGKIRTVWAGTNEHSMTNWFAHAKIWEHFDQSLFSK